MKGATKQLHLGIEAEETEVKEREFNQEFLVKMMDRLDWSAFVAAAKTVSTLAAALTVRISFIGDMRFLQLKKDDLPATKEEVQYLLLM